MVTSNFYHWAIRSFRGGAKSRALAVAALSAVVLPLAVAAASEGRRVTIGANRPMTETPAYAMPQPYEQTATYALPALRAVQTAPMMKAEPSTQLASTVGPAVAVPSPAATVHKIASTSSDRVVVSTRTYRKDGRARVGVDVSAPHTRVTTKVSAGERGHRSVRVSAPHTRVAVRDERVRVSAPYTRVAVDADRVRVRAPFVDLDIRF